MDSKKGKSEIIKCVRVSKLLDERIDEASNRLKLNHSDIIRICIENVVDDLKIKV